MALSFDGDLGLEDLRVESEDDVDEEVCYGVPFFQELFEPVDADELERRKREAEEEKKREAEEKKRREEELPWRREKSKSIINSIREFDPKFKTPLWTCPTSTTIEESAIPPMRHTGIKYQEECSMYWSANILSIKTVSSDVGFPLNVYGTVIARDSLDYKCIYLFRCLRRDSQLIKSEGKSLILIGPSRGFILQDFIFLEVDLKIKHERGKDIQLSKGLLEIDGRVVTRKKY